MRRGYMPTGYMPEAAVSDGTTLLSQIISAIGTRFATITTSNGYNTSAGNNVHWFRDHAWGASELPGIELRHQNHKVLHEYAEAVVHQFDLEVTALVAKGTSHSGLRNLLADVVRCVGVDISWGGLADDTNLPGAEIAVEQADKKAFGVKQTFVVEYTTGRFDPYN